MTTALIALKTASAQAGAVFARRVIFFLVVGLLVLAAGGFAVAAGWAALAAIYGSVIASLLIAGALLTVALGALALDAFIRRRRLKRRMRHAATANQALTPLLAQTFVAALQTGRSMGAPRS